MVCWDRLKTHDPEPYLAELRVGRILYINDANFRFVAPTGERGVDYDLEIIYPDGTIVCAETKCKIEGTDASAATINNALKRPSPSREGAFVFFTPCICNGNYILRLTHIFIL